MGSLKALISRVTSSDAEVEAEQLRQSSQSEGSVAVCDCHVGSKATVKGVVRSMIIEPSDTLPSLEAVVFDGTGSVKLIWMGGGGSWAWIPAAHPCHRPGVGQAGCPGDLQPRYELLPAED